MVDQDAGRLVVADFGQPLQRGIRQGGVGDHVVKQARRLRVPGVYQCIDGFASCRGTGRLVVGDALQLGEGVGIAEDQGDIPRYGAHVGVGAFCQLRIDRLPLPGHGNVALAGECRVHAVHDVTLHGCVVDSI